MGQPFEAGGGVVPELALVLLALTVLWVPAVVVWAIVGQLRLDLVPGGQMDVLDVADGDPAPPRVAELEAPSAEALRSAGLQVEHERLRYGATGTSHDLWLQSWIDPALPMRVYLISVPGRGPAALDQHIVNIWTDLRGPGELNSLVTSNMPNSTGDDETPLTDGLRLPGGDVRMLVRLHRARLAARQPMPTMQEQLAAADQITTGDRHSLDRRVRLGLVREVEPGRFRPTLRGAVITASRQLPPMKGRVDRQATQKAEEWIVRLPPEVG